MTTVKLNIDGREIETEAGKSVLDAALDAGIYIPHLCHHPDLPPLGGCRLCVVEIDSIDGLPPSCTVPAADGMVVRTGTPAADRLRRMAIELILAAHPPDCGTCPKYLNCELQSLKQYFSAEELRVRRRTRMFPVNSANPLFTHDPNKCIACGRCVRACQDLRGVGVLQYRKKGDETYIYTGADLPLGESGCRFCGACAEVCPTGAIQDRDELTAGKNRRAALVPCRYTCPAEIDVPRYVRCLQNSDYPAALAVIREKVPFPGTLGYVCDHPCENVCRRGQVNQPVTIRELKRFATTHDNVHLWKQEINRQSATGKSVGIVGSGPAGLTAAYYLALQGHEVTVYESSPVPGGMLRLGIPAYRLPREVIESEIREIEELGVKIVTDCRIQSIDELSSRGHDAVLVTIGTGQGVKLGIPGADADGVMTGTDFLKDINLGNPASPGKKVVVIGGGNVAFDCARSARRLGAEEVHIICPECRQDMPASDDEIEQGEAEGIILHPSQTAARVLHADGCISGVEVLDVASFTLDDERRPCIEVTEGSEHTIEADTAIFSVGQRPDVPPGFGLDTIAGGCISADPYSFSAGPENVFAAGDAVTGTSSVIEAIAAGRKVAAAIDRYLDGSGHFDVRPPAPTPSMKAPGLEPDFASRERRGAHYHCSQDIKNNYAAVVGDIDEDTAAYEAGRCLQCDLRLKIARVKFWGDY